MGRRKSSRWKNWEVPEEAQKYVAKRLEFRKRDGCEEIVKGRYLVQMIHVYRRIRKDSQFRNKRTLQELRFTT